MAFIDEEGKLFGKVNILDLIVVLGFVIVILIGLKSVFLPAETHKVTISMEIEGVQPYVVEEVNSGDQLLVGKGKILEKSVEPFEVVIKTENGDIVVREHPTLETLIVGAELVVEPREEGKYFDDQQVKVGNSLTLQLANTNLKGTVTGISR